VPCFDVNKLSRLLRLALVAAALLVLAGCVTSGGTSKEATNPFEGYSTDEILMTGDIALRSGEYDRALFLYMQAIEIEETADTWHRVGVTKIRLDDDIFAWKSFSKAVELDPEHSQSFEELGLLAMAFGQPEQAAEFLQKAIDLDKDNKRWRSHNALGVMADVDKRYDDAVAHYKTALDIKNNSAMLMNNIGYSYYLAGNLQEATFWFDEAFQAQRDYEPAIKNLALLYAREGWYEDAAKTFKKVMSEPKAYNDTGYIAMRNGDLYEAAELLTRAIRLSPSYYKLAYENLAQVEEELKRRAESGDSKNALAGDNVSEIIFPDNHETKIRKVMPQVLNVRAEPSADSEIVNYLKTGNQVEVIVSQPGWAFISYQTRSGGTVKGWVSTRFLENESLPAENSDAQARAVE
jgi:Flp pilus assembly protein TadD